MLYITVIHFPFQNSFISAVAVCRMICQQDFDTHQNIIHEIQISDKFCCKVSGECANVPSRF